MASAFPRERCTPLAVASAGLTTATTAYTSGDVLGSQLQFRWGDGFGPAYGELCNAFVIDKAAVIGTVELWLFSTAVTPAADNAAVSFSDADLQSLITVVNLNTSFATALNKVSMMDPTYSEPSIWCSAAGIMYGTLVTRSGHTFFGAATDLTVVLHIEPEA